MYNIIKLKKYLILIKGEKMKAQVFYNNTSHELDYEEIFPAVYVYKDAILREWDSVNRIESALKIPNTRFSWQPAKINHGESNGDHNSDYRKCFDFKINETRLAPEDKYSKDLISLYKQINTSLRIVLEHYKPENYLDEISYFECINIVKYGFGEYFKVHTDDGKPYRCTVSAVGYPNDDYSGGELWFPKFNVKYKPVAGDLIVFPSSYAYAHSSEPVLDDGIKYSFVMITDRNENAHRKDSSIYSSMDSK
jgi:hypothetical protein